MKKIIIKKEEITKLAHSLGLTTKKGRLVSESCINNMLKNPFYYGEMRVNVISCLINIRHLSKKRYLIVSRELLNLEYLANNSISVPNI